MVAIADKVASKLEEKKGSITEDEVMGPSILFLHLRVVYQLFIHIRFCHPQVDGLTIYCVFTV